MWRLTFYTSWDEIKGTILATNILAGTIDPNVGGLAQVAWQVQVQVAVQDFFVNASIGGSFKGSRHLQNKRIKLELDKAENKARVFVSLLYSRKVDSIFMFHHVIISWLSKFYVIISWSIKMELI